VKKYCILLLAALVLFASDIAAQGSGADGAGPAANPDLPTADQAMQQVRDELASVEDRWYGITRARWSYPQKFSVAVGAMVTEQRRDADCAEPCTLYGWHFEVEPGLYGVQGSVGWGKLVGETGNTEHLMHTVYLGWALRGVVMRTWGDSPLTPTNQTLAGIEGNFSLLRLNYSIGVLRSLSSDSSRDLIITAGIGWGF
jgi:hypothetical protein